MLARPIVEHSSILVSQARGAGLRDYVHIHIAGKAGNFIVHSIWPQMVLVNFKVGNLNAVYHRTCTCIGGFRFVDFPKSYPSPTMLNVHVHVYIPYSG